MTANSVSSVVPAMQSTALGVPLFLPMKGQHEQISTETTDPHHHQKGSSGVEEIACMVDVSPSGEIGEKFQVHCVADRRNFVRR